MKPLRMLILGGHGFLGSHVVRVAVASGHHVTVFSRRSRNADLPSEAQALIGDRYRDLHRIGQQKWDTVIDLSAFTPLGVRSLAQALRGRGGHYLLVSSVAAYEPPKAYQELREDSLLITHEWDRDPHTRTEYNGYREYGAMKVLCEQEAERQFPGRALIVRPGYIAGPFNLWGQLTYWCSRMREGGQALIAGDPSTPVQLIDVRDLAEWCVRLTERSAIGIYNASGPAHRIGLKELFETASNVVASPVELTWVPPAWLAAQEDQPLWGKLLFWSLEPGHWGWGMNMNLDRALAQGLKFRSLKETAADEFGAYLKLPPQQQAPFLTPALPWTQYLEHEKSILDAWRV